MESIWEILEVNSLLPLCGIPSLSEVAHEDSMHKDVIITVLKTTFKIFFMIQKIKSDLACPLLILLSGKMAMDLQNYIFVSYLQSYLNI